MDKDIDIAGTWYLLPSEFALAAVIVTDLSYWFLQFEPISDEI